ncbi:hypothetical protein SAMN06272735_5007 [Streptomyces sp. TLI_55]|uniref:hypothetical protein n=1 Tax=Streptomyces sp. TLI_55 TaxID=1938861 RepID=UPI000BDB6B05|nr:hypothetical protein [Streptomyces sp. TLI_55]SNX63205.1 hypothetical protein SAMN06272735_5007 [Streptomyces sp. TLI_55]
MAGTGSGDGQGVFSGIDAKALKDTIDSVRRDQDTLQSRASYYKAQLAYYGVGSEELSDVLRVADWAKHELPLLTRRYHLAMNLEDDPYPGFKGMVKIDESKVGQTAQAQSNGKKLGEDFKKKLDNGENIPPELFADLRANKSDADYLQAFYDALGPKSVLWLSNEMGDDFNEQYKDHPDLREKDRRIIAETFGVYTNVAFEGETEKEKKRLWNKWFDDSAMDKYDGFRPDRLTPFLKGGSLDKDFLVSFGDRVFSKDAKSSETRFFGNGGLGEGEWAKDNYQQLFSAIANNPEAAGEWFDHNNEAALKMLYPTGPWKVAEPKERGKAFFELLNAATVEVKQTNPSLAEKNTARVLFGNYQHRNGSDTKGLHPVAGTQALYASIIGAYWNDLEYGVTSPVSNSLWGNDFAAKGEEKYQDATKWNLKDYLSSQDAGRPGLEANEKVWRALMEESARDPDAAGTLSGFFQSYDKKMLDQAYATHESGENAGAYASMKRGMMQQFYVTTFKTASTELDMDIDKWVDDTNKFRESMIKSAGDIAMGATGGAGLAGAKGAAIGVAYGMGSDLATGWITDLAKVDAKDAPKGLKEAFKGVKEATADFSWQTDYRNNAYAAWKHHTIETVTIVTEGEKGGATTKEYTGDPKKYAKGAGNFLDKNGEIIEYSEMTSAQRTAYSNWLQDPAVVNAVWPEFSTGRDGRDYPGQDQ